MFNPLKFLFTKSSRAARLVAMESGGRARWTPRDYAVLARDGYARNAIVYRAVRLIAESIGALSFVLYESTAERDSHPLLDLVKRPNARQDGASLLEAVASHLLLAGNAYIEAVGLDVEGEARVRELYALRPDRMKLLPGPNGWPQAYEYSAPGSTVRFNQNAALPPIPHLTFLILSTTTMIRARWKLQPLRSTRVMRRHAGTGRCSTTPRARPARSSVRDRMAGYCRRCNTSA
jgi:phage portal protein BeeE